MSNFRLELLTLPELLIILFVALELVIVLVALVAMLIVRNRAISREKAFQTTRAALLDAVQRMTGAEPDPTAKSKALAALGSLSRDFARRLLTEMAELAGPTGTAAFEELYAASNLAVEARANAVARPWERLRVVREARALHDPARLLAGLVRDEVPDVRLGAFEALCALSRADEAVVAIPLLAADGRLNRVRAIDAMSAASPLPVQAMVELSNSEIADVRQIVVAVLGTARVRQAVQVVVHAVTDPDAEVRIQAVKGLREMNDASALPVCLSALQDERWEVRSEAARTCGALGGGGAAEAIAVLLDDEAEWVRHNASLALSRCGPAGIAALRSAAARGNESASSALAEARLSVTEGGLV